MAVPIQLTDFLAERQQEATFGKLLAELEASEAGVLLVGSVAEGRHTPASDLDLLVLLRGGLLDAHLLDREVLHPTALGSESLGFLGDLEVNLEYIEPAQARDLAAITAGYASALDPNATLVLPVPDIRQLRLFNRLRTGLTLCGGDVVEEWRNDIRTDLTPGFIAVLYFVTALDYLEDGHGWRERHPESALLMGREAATAATQAFLAVYGRTHHDPKWIALELDELDTDDDAAASLLRDCRFPTWPSTQVDAYLDRVATACAEVLVAFERAPGLEDHVNFTRRYCAGRYRYGVADFVAP